MVRINELPNITFVIHDVEGGVASMNYQFIENADFKKHFKVHIILWRSVEEASKNFRYPFKNVDSVENFYFSKFDNYYYILKNFNKKLNERPGSLVTNDGFELESIRKFGTLSVVISIVHDFYNLKLAILNLEIVDYFLCHTHIYEKALLSNSKLTGRVGCLLHGVKIKPEDPERKCNLFPNLNIVSISRLTASKGVMVFHQVNELLLKIGINVKWIIIGSGELENNLREQWKNNSNIEFCTPENEMDLFRIVSMGDIFISPSIFEGYGIALLEAMSCGLVPIINKLPVGVYSDLPNDVGISLPIGNTGEIVKSIALLHGDRNLLYSMSVKARQMVYDKYNIAITASEYLGYFIENTVAKIDRKKYHGDFLKRGILDRSVMPNVVTRIMKRLKGNLNSIKTFK